MGVCPAPRLARSVSASAAPLSLYIRAVTCIDGGRGFNIEAEYVKGSLVSVGAFLSVSHPGSPFSRRGPIRGVSQDSRILHRARLGDLLKEEVRAAPLFIPLYDYYRKYGGVYNLGAGPKWFVVVSDPVAVRTMFKDQADSFSKGILTDIMEPIMGDGLIPAPKEIWAKRRPTVGAGFHGAWLKHMVLLFGASATTLAAKLDSEWADKDDAVNLEDELYAMALDVIGKAVFNYEFGALKQETPLIKAVYRVLR